MDKRRSKIGGFLQISVVLVSILLGIFAEGAWAQPSVVSQNPPDGATNVLINTPITIQFNMTMDPGSSWFEMGLDGDLVVPGAVQWTITAVPNDTLVFIPQNPLRPATNYSYECNAQSLAGGVWVEGGFITKASSADTTPPTVQLVYPYDGMTNVLPGEIIIILFSEAMNPSTIDNTNITISGLDPSDYEVTCSPGESDIEVRKFTPFLPSTTYTVTISTSVRDVRGNPLKNEYSWSFETGAADTTPPTVTYVLPVNGDLKVNPSPLTLHAFFSEEMDETTFKETNITLYDDTAETWVPIMFYETYADHVSFGPMSSLAYGHEYIAAIGTGVTDRHGQNCLPSQYTWSFTTASEGVDSDPTVFDGTDRDEQVGQRWVDGSTRVQFELGAYDQVTFPLLVTATTSGHDPWALDPAGGTEYSYESEDDEGLTTGNHTITFAVQDGALNTVTFQRNIYIFSTTPTLGLPASGATGVSTTPTFEWSYTGGDRPQHYGVYVFDAPEPSDEHVVWIGYVADSGSGTQSVTIPPDKRLASNTTYYWAVRGGNREENGETFAGFWAFTTGGTPPPPASFANAIVRADNRSGGMRWNLLAFVRGPSPADIAEMKVTGPGGFRYVFTEDDINQSGQIGLYYGHDIPDTQFNSLSDGTYTFSVTDSQRRTTTADVDLTTASVPIVGTRSPADNTYVNSTTPTFSWNSVGEGLYYRLTIFDWNSNERPVYMSPHSQDLQATVPEGYLLADTGYKWCVDAYDSSQRNKSRSGTRRFSTGSSSYDLDLSYGLVWSDNSYYQGQRKSFNANVIGPLPNRLLTSPGYLTVTGPGGFTHSFSEAEVGHSLAPGNPYAYGEAVFPLDGDYTFTAQDMYGASGSPIVKSVTTAELPIVAQATMLPVNNAYVNSLTPTFSWEGVSGGMQLYGAGETRYYRVTINDWNLRYPIYHSSRSEETSVTLPAGILKPHRSYKWRVEVFDSSTAVEADNRSTSAWNCFTAIARAETLFDYDGDGATDIAAFHLPTDQFLTDYAGNLGQYGWGGSDAMPLVWDYDGDGKSEISIYHIPTNQWFVRGYPGDNLGQFGWGGDESIPVPGDYNGDGIMERAFYHWPTNRWFVEGQDAVDFGWDGAAFIPLPGDYDGDGTTDRVAYHIPSNQWFQYGIGNLGQYGWGGTDCVPVPADYNGDGKTDIAVYHIPTNQWFVKGYPGDNLGQYGWGGTESFPIPGDYDGDGTVERGFYRYAQNWWFIEGQSDFVWGWGGAEFMPITSQTAVYSWFRFVLGMFQ